MTKYLVNAIYPTIQGEGMFTGQPIVVVRLQGCSVGCPWCDTKETWEPKKEHQVGLIDATKPGEPWWTKATPDQIELYARDCKQSWANEQPLGDRPPGIALVSGGEPAEQDLADLVSHFRRHGWEMHLETSGTASGHLFAGFDHVTVSPKVDMPGGKRVLPRALTVADEIKWPVGKEADLDALELFLQTYCGQLKREVYICLQPISQSEKATALAIRTCHRKGYALSPQVHKLLSLP